ncbi:hypothetical protein M413DRAFT_23005 [Hebeloma cylindrosporum]|uniref:Uncharacterized protein n=1 Tax=Hebeloma cylindrosporum TaxID=76867 RepID=A0A0C3CCY3_HEBCY|nr:hypothetical protein M413DRAFT_23005 [Hebeloma cylindrosporum h7]
MASPRFEEILDGITPNFELQWNEIPYKLEDVQDYLGLHPACRRCIRMGSNTCTKLDLHRENLTVCFECHTLSKRCPRKVEFMATMRSRQMHQPVQDIIEEWEADLTPSHELYKKILELRGSLKEANEKHAVDLWSLGSKLEQEKTRVKMLIEMVSESNTKLAELENKNSDLTAEIHELGEENQRLDEELRGWKFSDLPQVREND